MPLGFNKLFRYPFMKVIFISVFQCCVFLLFIQRLSFGEGGGKNNDDKYNVIMIVVSALRADHLGCYGYKQNTSLNIDKLAKEGVVFERAVSQSYWTLPSLASILTSTFVSWHNIDSRDAKLGGEEKTLAEILRIYGYKTAAFTCGLDTAVAYGLNKGFDIYDVYDGSKTMGSFFDTIPKAVEWLNKNKKREFFLLVHSYDVHPPYNNCAENYFDKGYKGIFESSELDYNELKAINGREFNLNGRKNPLNTDDIKHIIARYDDCVKCADRFIGRFIEELKRLNLYDKSIIVLCSDHGEELGERMTFNRFGNQNLYQEVIRVPLIVKYPDRRLKAQRIRPLVQMVDIMPTILDLLNIPPGHELQGKSFAVLMKKNPKSVVNRYAVSEASKDKWAILSNDGWKLVYSLKGGELYNLSKDPSEQNNLIEKRLNKQVTLMKKFFLWRQHHKKDENTDNYLKLTPEMTKKLEEAGYW